MSCRRKPLLRSRAALADGLAAAALILGACGGGSSSEHNASPVPASLQRFYDHKLRWQPFPPQEAIAAGAVASDAAAWQEVAGFQCSKFTVPLDSGTGDREPRIPLPDSAALATE
jgi:hypothetical protein